MSVPRLTAAQFATQLKSGIASRDSTVDTDIGPVADWVVTPVSRVFEGQNERIRQLFQLLALQRPNELDPADIDAFVFNEQVIRSPGSPAFVDLVFFRKTAPTANLPIPANFPVATNPDPTSGSQVTFVTLTSDQIQLTTSSAYFNGVTGRYELRVPSKSLTVGDTAAVSKNRLIRPLRPLPGFDGVVNDSDSAGGNAAESNVDVVNRYFLRIRGTEIGTPAGLERYIRQSFSTVEDVKIIFGNDPALVRADTDAGAVDSYLVGGTPTSVVMTVTFPGRLNLIPVLKQPLVAITSVASGATFTEGVDYDVVFDSGIYSGSVRGQDGIRFKGTGGAPAVGDPLTITYQYDSLIVALQAYFATPEFNETGRDNLFRRGVEVQVAIQGVLTVKAGDPNTVLNVVIQSILDYINGSTTQKALGLGEDLQVFDVDAVVAKIPGVDDLVFSVFSRTGGTGVGDLTMSDREYARILASNLSISLA